MNYKLKATGARACGMQRERWCTCSRNKAQPQAPPREGFCTDGGGGTREEEDGAPCVCVLNKKRRDVFNIAVKIRTNVPNLTYL